MRKILLILLAITLLFIVFERGFSSLIPERDLTKEEITQLLLESQQSSFEIRDKENKVVALNSKNSIMFNKLFNFEKRFKELKNEIGIQTAFTPLSRTNILCFPIDRSLRFNREFSVDVPIYVASLTNKKDFVFSSKILKETSDFSSWPSPMGVGVFLLTWFFLFVLKLPSLEEPRFRFQIQLE